MMRPLRVTITYAFDIAVVPGCVVAVASVLMINCLYITSILLKRRFCSEISRKEERLWSDPADTIALHRNSCMIIRMSINMDATVMWAT